MLTGSQLTFTCHISILPAQTSGPTLFSSVGLGLGKIVLFIGAHPTEARKGLSVEIMILDSVIGSTDFVAGENLVR